MEAIKVDTNIIAALLAAALLGTGGGLTVGSQAHGDAREHIEFSATQRATEVRALQFQIEFLSDRIDALEARLPKP